MITMHLLCGEFHELTSNTLIFKEGIHIQLQDLVVPDMYHTFYECIIENPYSG